MWEIRHVVVQETNYLWRAMKMKTRTLVGGGGLIRRFTMRVINIGKQQKMTKVL
jgi:hypothetical protein